MSSLTDIPKKLLPPQSSTPSPYTGVTVEDLLKRAAKDGASQALRDMRQENKLSRNDTGHASEKIAAMMKKHRMSIGLTQRELARLAGVHPTTVGKVENAERGMSLVTFSKISQVFVDHDCTYFVYDVIEEVATWG
jgi:DNA-binding XRE family transcriptional regulator